MSDDLDLSTVFLLHEIEDGMNPEASPRLYERLWRPNSPTVAQEIIVDQIHAAIGFTDCE